jgi:hypothetical protein
MVTDKSSNHGQYEQRLPEPGDHEAFAKHHYQCTSQG